MNDNIVAAQFALGVCVSFLCLAGGCDLFNPPTTECGGIAGVPCVDGEFCRFDDGTCGAADLMGSCEEIPEVCTEDFMPVCGCDDVTYSNRCRASAEGVSVVSDGECE